MEMLHTLVIVLQVLSALGVIVLVLLQHGKGADMGAAFGSGASGSLFGATGSANFLSRLTGGLATVFFVCTLGLAFVTNKAAAPSSVMDQVQTPGAVQAPGADASIPPVSAPAAAGAAVPSAPAAGTSGAGTDAAQKEGRSSEIPK